MILPIIRVTTSRSITRSSLSRRQLTSSPFLCSGPEHTVDRCRKQAALLPLTTTTSHKTRYFSSSSSSKNDSGGDETEKESLNKRVKISTIEEGIVNVQLSRPDKLNGLDMPMFDGIVEAATTLKDDKSVRVVILSGEGRAFCTGLDVKSVFMKSNPRKNMARLLDKSFENRNKDASVANLAQNVAYLWRTLPVPVIAVLHGMCFGGGLQIALGADLRFSTRSCQISIMESKYGLIPDMSASITLRELIRADIARELTYTGRIITGEEAASLGLVTRVVDNPSEEALRVAREIRDQSPDAVVAAKTLFRETWSEGSEEKCLEVEERLQRGLIGGWNQIVVSGRSVLGVEVPFLKRGG
eukprot:CAMPEP_0172500040 /NCGR_PEP_ID=MMETSP1066-20121228/133821_1 /TAXON_ID=671091 /ORGANISM="Coscinodiscus wailesii, Strain CCMP2513" /LENGTH=356 /DNA_ID=CAMNT_0013274095 /DNA_START=98 /DNA_END=1168 /DNA_ORIENTATION=+